MARFWGGAPGITLVALGCGGVFGIEDLSDAPRPVAAGAGGQAGQSGDAGATDIPEQGGAGGSVAPDGAGGMEPTLGTAGLGGQAGTSHNDAGAPLTDAGTPDADVAPGVFVVSGRVIDFFRRPVPQVPVTIGQVTTLTNAEGQFSISGVEAPYDASLILNMTRNNAPARYAYRYEALTRADPTLQVYSALLQRSTASLTVGITNVDFEDPNRHVIFAFASPDGRFADAALTGPLSTLLGAPSWTGPAQTTGSAHALRVLRSGSFDGDPPVAYEATAALPLAVTDNAEANIDFDLELQSIASALVAGNASGGSLNARSNYVSVRFTDGTVLPLLDESPSTEAFSYLVPNLADSSLIVAAADGFTAPYAVVHREGIAPGQMGIALSVPNPVVLSAPEDAGDVTPSTTFAWSALAQTAHTFVWHLEFEEVFRGMFVITPRTQIGLPEFDGLSVAPDTPVVWSVETHGDAADVDALTGPDGFLDSFSVGDELAVGPNHNDGYFTESERRAFIMGSD